MKASNIQDRCFIVTADKKTRFAVVTPDPTDFHKIIAAWSYALRYSARGLDVPDYDAAVALLKQRHPSWEIFASLTPTVSYSPEFAEQDEPEI